MDNVELINKAVLEYFKNNVSNSYCKPKDLMPILIKYGLFEKDSRKGLPLRKILRYLDDNNEVYEKIPSIRIERKTKNRFWFFDNKNL